MKTKLLKIQGLTKAKAIEIEQLLDKNVILCLTETQQKVDSVNFSKGIQYETSMRRYDDKKGGGLMILYRESNDIYC